MPAYLITTKLDEQCFTIDAAVRPHYQLYGQLLELAEANIFSATFSYLVRLRRLCIMFLSDLTLPDIIHIFVHAPGYQTSVIVPC